MALAMQSAVASTRDADLMDIDIDMDLDDHGAPLDEEFQLEVQKRFIHCLQCLTGHRKEKNPHSYHPGRNNLHNPQI